ncbi:flagellar filament capping protein FliD [Bacillus sp. DTU_2020_1000418_1_SI_GHA_SEK_038]|uniref:flagellar filament capping protein FliD n=1 Tax=Bacillus sp. DTU_2020_1000418_1_SI_GHA_SEK_038 TaxID=3077585 RepID=UPI0028E6C3C2|nr:flagellar filament capping protein FliD [Bacillus sp. DTU_2020_1000418_1_SI_GHA_SEK_038]WNS75079.1 flagellar filament capping protein FliD [Bacillus sp. DTU_2020_1000418_1_SI_GHA_SEK_038]
MINNTTIRFSGLASGLDTESMIKQLVNAEKSKLIKLQQSKTINMWKTDSYREINAKLASFRTETENLRLQASFNKKMASVTNTEKIGATVTGNPSSSTYIISEATLATDARAASVSFKLDLAEGAIGEEISFKLNGKAITIGTDDTLSSAITKINGAGAGVTASYFKDGGSLILTSSNKAENSEISITDLTVDGDTVSTANKLGVVNGKVNDSLDDFSPKGISAAKGANAIPASVVINGLTINPTSNSFTYDGIKFDLKSKITSDQPVSMEIKRDTQSTFDNIKNFVEKYNELIAELNSKITEKRYRDFPPLTEEQKSEMKDREIELWEDKAKSGMLNGDRTISKFLTDLRSSLGAAVETGDEGFKFLFNIGITTSKEFRDNGKLEIDETKLKAAIENNLESVIKLFTATSSENGTTITSKLKHDESGIGRRLYERINWGVSELSSKAGSLNSATDVNSLMAKELKNINSGITREEQRLAQVEARYWRQFQAMESALQRANSQSGWLMQQFGGGM